MDISEDLLKYIPGVGEREGWQDGGIRKGRESHPNSIEDRVSPYVSGICLMSAFDI